MADNTPTCMSSETILASTVAEPFMQELKTEVSSLDQAPKLVGFLANVDPAAKMYAEWTGKTSMEAGFQFELRQLDKEDLEEKILEANTDPNVHGIMIYWPVFGTSQDTYLQQTVAKEKDVEGLSHIYISNMYHNIRFLDDAKTLKSILPCTPLAMVKILEHLGVYNKVLAYGNRLYGKTVCIVNRSEVVGRPLAALLANDGATVYSVDITGIQKFTRGAGIRLRKHEVEDVSSTLKEVVPLCDVVITGVPSDNYKFPTELLRDGAVCINFSSAKNFDAVAVKEKAAIYIPSIGKVTQAMLLRNLLRLRENQKTMSASK
ncbi:methylenetetrahydrofolate dehydrogenase [Planoprotostelium fungivorum]|uniref:Methylenetetrahydrofolate dehydrogenase [NAD(+)] n=1 Tax=Planoprotostelium fungivorum TaxID=1890364 RepID=A0A2P6MND1_9EUKA|nr:methylenetetrahydrofolate dehydrogenase [Planoprotostelium fungivorum]